MPCTVKIDEKTIITTGGNQPGVYSDKTWIYNFGTTQWISGPPMNIGRDGHACGKFELGDNPTVVVSGGYKSGGYIDSVEFMDWNGDRTWIEGNLKF